MRFLFLVFAVMAVMFWAMPVVPWVMVGLVVWGAMMLLRPPRRRYHQMYWQRPRPVQQPRPQAPQKTERPGWERLGSGLPLDVQVKVEQIRRKSQVLERERWRFPLGSEDGYIIRATAEDYLPRTLEAYMAVPVTSRDKPMPNGRTALQELKEQLHLLDTKLDEIAEDLQRKNFDRLLLNRQFLEARFGRKAEPEVVRL